MDILLHPNAILRRKAKRVEVFDNQLRQVAEKMFDAMYSHRGIGLAANQVGQEIRLAVVDLGAKEEENEGKGEDGGPKFVMANPEVQVLDPEEVGNEEGCLSVPEVRAEIRRPRRIRLKAQSLSGEEFLLDAEGMLAVCIQHEVDHLNGVLFFDHLNQAKREELLKKYFANQ